MNLETIEVETGPRAAVIWLHGLGADGHDFEPIVPELGLPGSMPVRFVFPNAPLRPVTINMGMRMRAWYDILQLGGGAEDKNRIRELRLAGKVDRVKQRKASG
jgi:phospholipase/carboxylesterase